MSTPKSRRLKKGDLVYLKNVGHPFNHSGQGYESWEGASCIILNPSAGHGGTYVEVRPLIPVKSGGIGPMTESLFHPEQCILEDRPWLKKHIRDIVKMREQLNTLADAIKARLS